MSTADTIGDALSYTIFAIGWLAIAAGAAVAAWAAWRRYHDHR